MNKILKNILLTILITFLFLICYITIYFAQYGIYVAILSFPEICSLKYPNYCIGTSWFIFLTHIAFIYYNLPIWLFIITSISIAKIWNIPNLLFKIFKTIKLKVSTTEK